MAKQVYTTSNGMVWEYIRILDRIISNLHPTRDKDELRQDISLCILLSVMVVETFMNLFFQDKVSKAPYDRHKGYIFTSIRRRDSIDYKIKNWPKRLFKTGLDFSSGIGKKFNDVKNVRNHLMHFSSIESLNIDGHEIHGLSNIGLYESLQISDAINAVEVVEETIIEILKLSDLSGSFLIAQTQRWTGKGHA